MSCLLEFCLAANVLRLGEGGDLTTNVHTKHTLQIYEKLSYEALNRHFCQTAVPVAQLKGSEKLIYKKNLVKYF